MYNKNNHTVTNKLLRIATICLVIDCILAVIILLCYDNFDYQLSRLLRFTILGINIYALLLPISKLQKLHAKNITTKNLLRITANGFGLILICNSISMVYSRELIAQGAKVLVLIILFVSIYILFTSIFKLHKLYN